MASLDQISYLDVPLNPYVADYDLDLRSYSECETRRCDEDVWREYGLLRDTRQVPRDASSPGHQKLVDDKVITEDLDVVIAYKTNIQEAELGALPCIVYIHGGNRYGGTPYSGFLERAEVWAARFDAIAISVNYRLSPNEPDESPTGEEPTNDCFDALTWLYHRLGADEDSILKHGDRTKLIVFGTSAGGGLAASTVMKWCQERRQGFSETHGDLYGLVLEAPQLDDRCNTQSHDKFKHGNMYTSRDAEQGWEASLGARRGTEHVSIFEAPARAVDTDVKGFPPTYIEVGGAEPFRDEVENLSNTLRKAKVEVEMNVWEGGFHGFFTAEPNALVSRLCNLTKLRWLCRRLGVQDKGIDDEYDEVKEAYDARPKGG
ncbi:Alpha/Beta hydrolase protein [Xylaria digitata]|nr:Alpha/Beta hydrolase protein [Xylaria digitata]